MAFKILSCDGGGIRGLITALLIQDLDRRSGILAKADGFAGTSTGGLIALALARGVSISEVVDVYRNRGARYSRRAARGSNSGRRSRRMRASPRSPGRGFSRASM
ncbi:hypothetical protein NCM_00942 [Burkholderia pseudomallei]